MQTTDLKVIFSVVTAATLVLKKAGSKLEDLRQGLLKDMHVLTNNTISSILSDGLCALSLDCEQELLHLRRELRDEVIALTEILFKEYSYGEMLLSNMMTSGTKDVEDQSSSRALCQHQDVTQASFEPVRSRLNAPVTVSTLRPFLQRSASVSDCDLSSLIEPASARYHDFQSSIPSLSRYIDQPSTYSDTVEAPLNDFQTPHTSHLSTDIAESKNGVNLQRAHFNTEAATTASFLEFSGVLKILTAEIAKLTAHLREINAAISTILSSNGTEDDIELKDLQQKLQLAHPSNSASEVSVEELELERKVELRRTELIIKHQQSTNRLLDKKENCLERLTQKEAELKNLLQQCDAQIILSQRDTEKKHTSVHDQGETDAGETYAIQDKSGQIREKLHEVLHFLNSVEPDICLPAIIFTDLHNRKVLDPEPKEIGVVPAPFRKLLLSLWYEELAPTVCTFLTASSTQDNITDMNALLITLQKEPLNISKCKQLSTSFVQHYMEIDSISISCASILDKLRLLKTVWEDILELGTEKSALLYKVEASLSPYFEEMSHRVTAHLDHLAKSVSDAFLFVLQILRELESRDMQTVALNKLGMIFQDFIQEYCRPSYSTCLGDLAATLPIKNILDSLLGRRSDTAVVQAKRNNFTITWTMDVCARIQQEPCQKDSTLLLHPSASMSNTSVDLLDTLQQCQLPDIVRSMLLTLYNRRVWEDQAQMGKSKKVELNDTRKESDEKEIDLHVSSLTVKDIKNSNITPAAEPTKPLDTSLLICKIAHSLTTSGSHQKDYIRALKMSQYPQLCKNSLATNEVLDFLTDIRSSVHQQKTSIFQTNIGSNRSKSSMGEALKVLSDVLEHEEIYRLDRHYKELYVVDSLISLKKSEVQILEYTFGYIKLPQHVGMIETKAKSIKACTISVLESLTHLVVKQNGIMSHSISVSTICAVSNKPFMSYRPNKGAPAFYLTVSTRSKGDFMFIFTEERGSVVFRIGLQTMVKHRRELPRLVAVSRAE